MKIRVLASVMTLSVIALAGCSSSPSPVAASPTASASVPADIEVSESPTAVASTAPEASPSAEAEAVAEQTGPVPVTAANLDEALSAAGIPCEADSEGLACDIDGQTVGVLAPSDVEADQALRKRACDEGYINTEYEVVGDGSTWYAVSDYQETSDELIARLDDAGYAAELQPYCPSAG